MTNQQDPPEHQGILSFSRVQHGKATQLFGSKIKTNTTIEMRLSSAEKERDYNQDYFFARKRLIQIEMTPSQFSELITTLNIGSGVPVTIRYINDRNIIQDIEDEDIVEENKQEFIERCQKIEKNITNEKKEIEKILTSKKPLTKDERERIRTLLNYITRETQQNLPFILDQFEETVDQTIQEAKTEMDSFVTNVVTNIGLDRLKDLQIGSIGLLENQKEE